MRSSPTATSPLPSPASLPFRHRRALGGAALIAALLMSQAASADKVWNASPNPAQNNWISGMYAGIGGELSTTLQGCEQQAATACSVSVLANGGVHASASDARHHFTVRFNGTSAPFTACHIYPADPATVGNKALAGAQCFNAGVAPTYFKLK